MTNLTSEEKAYLREIITKDLEHFRKEKKTLFIDIPVKFLEGEHDYQHFLEELLKKLQD